MTMHPEILPASETAVIQAAGLLRDGHLVAVPTETVYLAVADATSDDAVEGLFGARQDERLGPVAILVSDLEEARRIGDFDPAAAVLAAALWPGPLTLAVPRRADAFISPLVTPGTDTVFLRVPSHPTVRALLRVAHRPLASAGAHRPGTLPATSPLHAAQSLGGRLRLVVAAGKSPIGIESTRLQTTPAPRLLRAGPVLAAEIESLLGVELERETTPGPSVPARQTNLPLRLDAVTCGPDEALLAFGPDRFVRGGMTRLNLSEPGDLHEAASNFYAMLRTLDRAPQTAIAVMPIPDQGLGAILNQKLRRAAGLDVGSHQP